eukprot:12466530-Heterocapsa_arctica.AAC.1
MKNRSYYMRIKIWKKSWLLSQNNQNDGMVAPIEDAGTEDTPGSASSGGAVQQRPAAALLPAPEGPVAMGFEPDAARPILGPTSGTD